MRFLDLFAGIGGFRLGMEQAGHECIGYVEIDKFARKSYEAIHDTEGEWTAHDITRITDDDIRELGNRGHIDVICGGFPCQAFSVAGKRGGFNDTRGTLFFEIVRIANILRPQYLFLENVKGLLNHDGGNTFETILRTLDELGYDAEWEVLNSKDFGVPQNRERVFIIGHLRGGSTRKVFPIHGANGTNNVAEIKTVGMWNGTNRHTGQRIYSHEGIFATLTTKDHVNDVPKITQPVIQKVYGSNQKNAFIGDGSVSPSLTSAMGMGGGHTPMIEIKEATKKGYAEAEPGDSVNYSLPNSKTRRGRVGKQIANTLDTGCQQGVVTEDIRIRKLTPRECWRLQGFPDWAFDKAAEVNSDSQLYKQSGNSVTVNVIYEIAKRL